MAKKLTLAEHLRDEMLERKANSACAGGGKTSDPAYECCEVHQNPALMRAV